MLRKKIASAALAGVLAVGVLGVGATGAQAASCGKVAVDKTNVMASCSGKMVAFVIDCWNGNQNIVQVKISNGGQSVAAAHGCGSKGVQQVKAYAS
ncbi:hypothetical protein [Cellulomonas triticagri]|uniref:Secreted protein n=1 Tax=Cellulomonas triticagri TaxID=2483352 RepID=A0A3M2IYC1_9CELL|nr:hypothetical protein [Cellulomonas triticagri]RMI06862.1 hypothetical protein EBM89_14780 [Cellulomonas triticagri]